MTTATTTITKTKESFLTVPYSAKAKRNILKIQKSLKKKHGGLVTVKNIAAKILENTTL